MKPEESIAVVAFYGSVQLAGGADIGIGCLAVVEYPSHNLVCGLLCSFMRRVRGRRAIEITRLEAMVLVVLSSVLPQTDELTISDKGLGMWPRASAGNDEVVQSVRQCHQPE